MRGFRNVASSHDQRLGKQDAMPIVHCLMRAIYEFAKQGVEPSELQSLVVSSDLFDRLFSEVARSSVFQSVAMHKDGFGKILWMEIQGVKVERGK